MSSFRERYDVVIVGAGLAGLSLARQLLLETDRRVLLLERREEVPPRRQKVGESLVQLGGYYFSRVLDLEEHLLREHYLKYNLRFHWKTAGRANDRFEDYSQGYIRTFSNVASYQLDRNVLEAELLRLVRKSPRLTFEAGVRDLEVELAERSQNGERPPHLVRRGGREAEAEWVVDATGRGSFLARKLGLRRPNRIRHGSFFWWVDGLVDVERLTDATPRERRLDRRRRRQGHLPAWLATNHFMGDGFWFWVIPLQGKTSLGLVFDTEKIDASDVFSVEKATEWVCREFPLFARDLPEREVLDFGGFRSFSYDCASTIDPSGWALTGEAGRFSDPLYSPGSDLIAIYNTLIVDAVETGDPVDLANRCALYEQLMRSAYSAYLPSYEESYDALGDPESMSLKYGFELATYFVTYVFPFVNDLLTDRRFAVGFLRQFARLGPVNRNLQAFLSGYYRWLRENLPAPAEPVLFDFTELGPLARAEKAFYEVGLEAREAKEVLAAQVGNLLELARFVVAHAASVVLGEPAAREDRGFVEALDPAATQFDPEELARLWTEHRSGEPREWSFDPTVVDRFGASRTAAAPATAAPNRPLEEAHA